MERQPREQEKEREEGSGAQPEGGGLASLLGKYDDDPTWEEFQAIIGENRRQLDEPDEDSHRVPPRH